MYEDQIEYENGHTVMYRPTGPNEYKLVKELGFRAWPPRLEGQPIFYPVTNEKYATEITQQWNVKDDKIGYVFRFLVKTEFARLYKVEKVGGAHHTEWWIPAEHLDKLNENIIGELEIIGEYGE